jgi:HSP20 family protein
METHFLPEVDIFETEEGLRLWADMPGVGEKDVEVTLRNGMLTIKGVVSTEMYRNLLPVYTEYNVGNYHRQFMVNEEIDANRIEACIRSGVLEVSLPKAETARPRHIEVKAG